MAKLLRPSELAKMLSVPQQKIYQWAKRGLPLHKTPEGTRIDFDEAKEFFERLGISLTDSAIPQQVNATAPRLAARGEVPSQRTTVATVAEGQFLVWPKGVSQGVTIGKVTKKEPSAGVVVVKCSDGSDAIFSIKDLNRLIREGKVVLIHIAAILELIAEELRYYSYNTLADQIKQVCEEYLKVTRVSSEPDGEQSERLN